MLDSYAIKQLKIEKIQNYLYMIQQKNFQISTAHQNPLNLNIIKHFKF
jgi:hypothetical protein